MLGRFNGCLWMNGTRISRTAKHNSRRLRKQMTDAENALWRHLRMRQIGNLKFRRQHPLGMYILDFACLEVGLVVEVDGGQHAESVEQDNARTEWLETQGFRVLRFWNNDVLMDADGVKLAIWQALGLAGAEPPSQPSPCLAVVAAQQREPGGDTPCGWKGGGAECSVMDWDGDD